MREIIPVRRLIEQAEANGQDPDCLMVDRDDVLELDPDELADLIANPDEENPSDEED